MASRVDIALEPTPPCRDERPDFTVRQPVPDFVEHMAKQCCSSFPATVCDKSAKCLGRGERVQGNWFMTTLVEGLGCNNCLCFQYTRTLMMGLCAEVMKRNHIVCN